MGERDDPGEPRPGGEPAGAERCPTSGMQVLSAELVGRPTDVAVESARGSEDPDSEWVARWQAGDTKAFEVLVKRHESRVYRLLLRMLGSAEEAEDAAQEAFLSLHRHGHRFRHDARFSTFVYRVAANAALNRRRTLARKNARLRKLQTRQAAGDDLPTTPRDPESATFGGQVQIRVQDALLQLPPDLRAATVLYDIEGLSYREIAAVLEIPEGTVKSRIHRARSALRDRLKGLVSNENKGERT